MRFELPHLCALALALAWSSACDTRCVGPDCPQQGDDDDDDTPMVFETMPELVEQRSCSIRRVFLPATDASSMDWAGELNDWTPDPLQGPDAEGQWQLVLDDPPVGHWGFKLLTNGLWEETIPPDVPSKWVDGVENRRLVVGDCQQPLLQLVSAEAWSAGDLRVEALLGRAEDGSPLDPASVSVRVGDTAASAEVDPETGRIVVEATGLPPGKHSVTIQAADEAGRTSEGGPLWVPLWVEEEAWDWRDGLIYFAFTDRFRDGDYDQPPLFDPIPGVAPRANYAGGDFLGVLDALDEDYFTRLGANILWLSPAYENAEGAYIATDGVHNFSGFHGYWPIDPLGIEERFGDAGSGARERLRQVIDAAHAKGIRVMFDLVLNHVHEDHLYRTEHPEWFGEGCVCQECGWEERRLDCWFTPYLPDLDYRNHEVLRRVVQDTVALLQDLDIDAVRVDAAKHMDHVIMRSLRQELDTIGHRGAASFVLIGETYTGGDGRAEIMEYVADHELHGQFDFPLYWSIRGAFAGGGSFRDLEAAVAAGEAAYGGGLMSPFLGNHDVPRFATEAAGNDGGPWGETPDLMAGGGASPDQEWLIDRLALAHAFTLTQPGLPLLYYGDEIGLAGAGDPDNRRQMNFEPYLSSNQASLLGRVRAIGQARASSTALRRGSRTQLWVDDDLLVYALEAGDEIAVVALNKSDLPRTELVPTAGLIADGAPLLDQLDWARTAAVEGGNIHLELAPWSYAILAPQ